MVLGPRRKQAMALWMVFLLSPYSFLPDEVLVVGIEADDVRDGRSSTGSGSGSASGSGWHISSGGSAQPAVGLEVKSTSQHTALRVEGCVGIEWTSIALQTETTTGHLESDILGNATVKKRLISETLMMWSDEGGTGESRTITTNSSGKCAQLERCLHTAKNHSRVLEKTDSLLRTVERCGGDVVKKLKILSMAVALGQCLSTVTRPSESSGALPGSSLNSCDSADGKLLQNHTWNSSCFDALEEITNLINKASRNIEVPQGRIWGGLLRGFRFVNFWYSDREAVTRGRSPSPLGGPGACSPGKFWKLRSEMLDF